MLHITGTVCDLLSKCNAILDMFTHYCLGDVWVRIRKTIVQTDGDGRAGANCEYNTGILGDQPQKPLMAIMPLAMAIIAHVEYGHSLVVLLSYNI